MGRLNNIYNSSKWRALRERKIQNSPICELCNTIDILTPAAEIDHWLEIIDFRMLIWDLDNLVSLCAPCHRQKTAEYRRIRATPHKLIHWCMDYKPSPMSDAHIHILRQYK
ncbi:hypothetical protein PE36_00110 [Moritella sp. PE36]|uniref:HNH endonuclease signature motif containing protein n=1 Tax=Moritella sp. PE36 TaxID=58051 RepID=UPI0001569277|nr:hypothetical protein PE36_00110 [Moritella sp. PE36]